MQWDVSYYLRGHHDPKNQLLRYIYSCSEKAIANGYAARDALVSRDDVKARQEDIMSAFLESVGGLPPMDTPLNPKTTGNVQCEGFRIENIIFESRPKVYVTANMYIPDGTTSPTGAVLFVCGHHDGAKHADEYQIVCRHLVTAGLVVLAIDPVGQGERYSYYDAATGKTYIPCGVSEHDYAGAQCLPLGDSLARYFAHDAMRAIDYLISRPEVDSTKIGVTGNSGGGLQTGLLMMCDRRIAAAAPATYVMNREEYMYQGAVQDAEQIHPGMTGKGFDHEDVLIAMAPKPVLVLAVEYDFFPIEGTRKTYNRVKRFWEMHDKTENLELFVDKSTHKYTLKMAVKAAEFFSLHLLGEKMTPCSDNIRAIDCRKLWCTEKGQVIMQFPDARFVYEENIDRYKNATPWESGVEWLRSKVIENREYCELNTRHFGTDRIGELTTLQSLWRSQKGLYNFSNCVRKSSMVGKTLPVTLAIWEGGTTQVVKHISWLRRECAKGRAVLIVDVTGTGTSEPNLVNSQNPSLYGMLGTIHKLAQDLIWIGDSLAAIRTYDIVRAVDALNGDWPDVDAGNVNIYASGRYGLYAYLAAALDKRIVNVETDGSYESYETWVTSRFYNQSDIYSYVFPGLMKYCDVKRFESI